MEETPKVRISEVSYTHRIKGLRLTLCQNGKEIQEVLYLGSTQRALKRAVRINFRGACYDLAWASTNEGSGKEFRGYHVPLEVMIKTYRGIVNTSKREGTGLLGLIRGVREDIKTMKQRKEAALKQYINI